jgi:hypothetical protein
VEIANALAIPAFKEPDAFWTAIIIAAIAFFGTILTIVAASRSLSRQLRKEADSRATEQRAEWNQRRKEQSDEWAQRRKEQSDEWERQRADKAEESESVARAIGEEVALIAAEIVAHHVNREAGLASPSSEIATPMFDAVGYRIGELQATREIAFFHTQVRLVSRVLGDWDSYYTLLERSTRGEIGGGAGLDLKARKAREAYFSLSRDVVAYAEELIPKLQEQITKAPPLELHSRLADLPPSER